MTAKLDVRFKKPVPIGEKLRVVGEITRRENRLLEGQGKIWLADGTVAAEATGVFIRIPDSKRAELETALTWWRVEE
jgi:acyl-CoA thioesterase FadM